MGDGRQQRTDPLLDAYRADTESYAASLPFPIGVFIWSLRSSFKFVLWLVRKARALLRA